MNKLSHILGIDIGTSSLKMLYNDGQRTHKLKLTYDTADTDGWWKAICNGAKSLDLREVQAIGLSSQVGTYIVDGGAVIAWQDSAGAEELSYVLESVPREVFIKEIDMPHPELASYPLPRLLYIKKHFPKFKTVCQPKDYICKKLTGRLIADKFSYRGIANLENCRYSSYLLEFFGLDASVLPPLADPRDIAGKVTHEASIDLGIPEGTPVVLGCNDFFAGLIGMGIWNSGDAFDISGTSEHMGLVRCDIPKMNDRLVFGGFFNGNVHYGVTASSGSSLDFGMSLAELSDILPEKVLSEKPPIFLPYLNGERAPIWDGNARGVFFGIEKNCSKEALAYSVAEGVCFSLYQIYEKMGSPEIKAVRVSGGAGKSRLLNQLKASLFSCPVNIVEENDASAYGVQLIASVGIGKYGDIPSAILENVKIKESIFPNISLREELLSRFELYRALYPALREEFIKLNNISKTERNL